MRALSSSVRLGGTGRQLIRLLVFCTVTCRLATAKDLIYQVQVSEDLVNFTELYRFENGAVTNAAGFVQEFGSGPTFTVEVRDPTPIGTAGTPRRFLVITVSR